MASSIRVRIKRCAFPCLCVAIAAAVLIVFRGYLLGYDDQSKKPRESLIGDAALAVRKLKGEGAMPDKARGVDRLLFTQREPVDPARKGTGVVTDKHYLKQILRAEEDSLLQTDAGWGLVEPLQKELSHALSLTKIMRLVDAYRSWRKNLWEYQKDGTDPDTEPMAVGND